MKRILIITVLSLQLGCKGKVDTSKVSEQIPKDSIDLISKLWKEDSMGCFNHRDPRIIIKVIEQTQLNGKDTSALIQYLGKPNDVDVHERITNYSYFLECSGDRKISYSNFYCYFRGDTLWYCSHSIY